MRYLLFSILVILAIGFFAVPDAFAMTYPAHIEILPSASASHVSVTVQNAAGSSTPRCEKTNECFIPSMVTIDVGGTVTWENVDNAAHTVTSGTAFDADSVGKVWDSGIMLIGGAPFSYTFDAVGTYPYFCMIHPWMQGTVMVQATLAEMEKEMAEEEMMESERETMVSEMQQQAKGGGCLIATATFGSELAPQVQFLRELRDNTVLQTESGTSFMAGFNQFYYSFSPTIADYERENPEFKEAVKIALTPLLTSLTLLQYADIDSESEMLGYGIGIILLNIGMYFVAPAVLIMTVRKRI